MATSQFSTSSSIGNQNAGLIDLTQDDEDLPPSPPEDDSVVCLTPRVLNTSSQHNSNEVILTAHFYDKEYVKLLKAQTTSSLKLIASSYGMYPVTVGGSALIGHGACHPPSIEPLTGRERKRTVNNEHDQHTNLHPKKVREVECGVCYDGTDEIRTSGRELVSTICGHVFCNECLLKSIKETKMCPNCRKKLTQKQYHPIFL